MQRTTLHCTEGNSDKLYVVEIAAASGGHVVTFAYGRRGSMLTRGEKTKSPVPLAEAERIAQRLIDSKVAKGYQIIDREATPASDPVSGTAPEAPVVRRPEDIPDITVANEKSHSPIRCQLLNPIDDNELNVLLTNAAYCVQVKEDGVRQLIVRNGDECWGVNRKGKPTVLPDSIVTAVRALPCRQVVLDGEGLGETNVVFDLLELDGMCLRHRPYRARLTLLNDIVTDSAALRIVATALDTEDKVALVRQTRLARGEGVVVKSLDARYEPGRPNSGGPQLKHKFYATASVLVAEHDPAKRSVVMALMSNGQAVKVGKVTIPPNHDVPPVGAVIEVRYLYAYPRGALYQPIYLGQRNDVDARECEESQIKYKQDAIAA